MHLLASISDYGMFSIQFDRFTADFEVEVNWETQFTKRCLLIQYYVFVYLYGK